MMTSQQLEQLIQQHRRALELFACQWSSAPEDCVQEAFLKLFRNRTLISNPRAWLFRVVRNLAIDSQRSSESRKNRERTVCQDREWFQRDRSNEIDPSELQWALGELPDDLREVVVARVWGQLTLEEIADAFGIAPSTVHRRYQMGIRQLQQFFEVSSRSSNHE